MPQLDITTFPPQLFWLAITFVVLYILMSRLALPRVGDILRTREERITGDLDRAERLNREAEDALKAYETALAEARARAGEIAARTRAAIQAEAEARQAEAEARLAAQLEAAEARIRETRDQAMGQVRGIAADTATALVARLLGNAPEQNRLDQAVSEELDRRGVR
ncbi:MAG: F0F1 ATP synthase subunit B' [Alphaproteobacteria bacterium]|nr:F0F1 ATP synthase subunit B' [Alphaproteobacteria bacterium]